MKTAVVAALPDRDEDASTDAVARAVELLKQGEVVALPTETVYGLAADALRPEAVIKIFEVKERPRFDPLIVHLPDSSWLERVAKIPTQDRELALQLTDQFWPGPFTIVLPKTDLVPDIVTAGLDTVAVRISAHPVLKDVLTTFAKPLAAPSANRFGRISPTTAQHVENELGGRIPLIVDAGPTTHGLESTVVAVKNGQIKILRPGPITEDDLRRGIGGSPMRHRPMADAKTRGIGFQAMNPRGKIAIRFGANLPHWIQSEATYAVVFRLADSLPQEVIREWQREKDAIARNAKRQGRGLTDLERQDIAKIFSEKVERYLDAGIGKCWLRDERIATLVRDALLFFDRERYDLYAWCLMPNHVHAVVQPRTGFELREILHSWKSFTALRANQLLNRKGEFWQPESYDHLIRDEQDLRNQIRYTEENPDKAGLRDWPWVSSGIGFQPMSHRQDADATVPQKAGLKNWRWVSRGVGGSPTSHRPAADATTFRSPGQLPSHYAPKTRLRILESLEQIQPQPNERVGALAWAPVRDSQKFAAVRHLSDKHDLREAAANLFGYLRELDQEDLDLIVAETVPEEGLGIAINDRLRRAATL